METARLGTKVIARVRHRRRKGLVFQLIIPSLMIWPANVTVIEAD